MDKELINKVAEIYRERSVYDLSKAKEIITLVTQANKAAVIEAVNNMGNSPLEDGKGDVPKNVYNYYMQGRGEAYAETLKAITTALDTEVK